MQNQKGFTIIELIVVVVIVAVLAGIVVSNVNKYNPTSKNAAIKSMMKQITTAAVRYFEANGKYANMETGSTDIVNICAGLKKVAGITEGPGCPGLMRAIDNEYCYVFTLQALPGWGTAHYWCVDSTGAAMELTATAQCTTTGYHCAP